MQFVNNVSHGFIPRRTDSNHVTRGSVRGDCPIPMRKKPLSQSALTVRGLREWTLIPNHIRQLSNTLSVTNSNNGWLMHTHDKTNLFPAAICLLFHNVVLYVDLSAYVCLYVYLFAMSFYVWLISAFLTTVWPFLIFKLHVWFFFCFYIF